MLLPFLNHFIEAFFFKFSKTFFLYFAIFSLFSSRVNSTIDFSNFFILDFINILIKIK